MDVEAFAPRRRCRISEESVDEAGNLEGKGEERGKHDVFDEDVDEPVESSDRPPADELLEEVHPHPLEAGDVEEVEDVFPEAVEMGERRLLHHLRTRRPV